MIFDVIFCDKLCWYCIIENQNITQKLSRRIWKWMSELLFYYLFVVCRVHHQGDKRMPIFQLNRASKLVSGVDKEKSLIETLNQLTTSLPHPSVVCSVTPCHVMENKSFIMDKTKLEHIDDLLADDCGSWWNNGQHSFHCWLTEDG